MTSLPPATIIAEFALKNASKRYITCIFTIFGRFVIIGQLGEPNRVQIWILLEIPLPEVYNIMWFALHLDQLPFLETLCRGGSDE
jgi:hypothetical protein